MNMNALNIPCTPPLHSNLTTVMPYSGPTARTIYVYKWANGHECKVTFVIHVSDQTLLVARPEENWYGSNPTINIHHLRHGLDPMSGTFQIALEGDKSEPLVHNLDKGYVKTALEYLRKIGEVHITRFPNNNGFNYFVTFITEMGDLDTISTYDAQLSGPNDKYQVVTI